MDRSARASMVHSRYAKPSVQPQNTASAAKSLAHAVAVPTVAKSIAKGPLPSDPLPSTNAIGGVTTSSLTQQVDVSKQQLELEHESHEAAVTSDSSDAKSIKWTDELRLKLASMYVNHRLVITQFGDTDKKKKDMHAAFIADADVQRLLPSHLLKSTSVPALFAQMKRMIENFRSRKSAAQNNSGEDGEMTELDAVLFDICEELDRHKADVNEQSDKKKQKTKDLAKATADVQQLQSVIEINSDEPDVSEFSSSNANLSSPNANLSSPNANAIVIASPNANAVVSPPNAKLNSNNSHREKNDDRVKVSLSQKRPLADASKINITDSTTASNNMNQFILLQKDKIAAACSSQAAGLELKKVKYDQELQLRKEEAQQKKEEFELRKLEMKMAAEQHQLRMQLERQKLENELKMQQEFSQERLLSVQKSAVQKSHSFAWGNQSAFCTGCGYTRAEIDAREQGERYCK